jgi:fermentation-respiration switch protein FrsA (DUF1100 family)
LKDELVPQEMSMRLYKAATSAKFKMRHEVPDGDHNSTWRIGGDEYVRAIKAFFIKCEQTTE